VTAVGLWLSALTNASDETDGLLVNPKSVHVSRESAIWAGHTASFDLVVDAT